MKNRIGAALLAAAMCLGVLAGCGSKNKSVAVYQLGEDQVVSLDSIIDEGEALLTSIDEPTDAALEAGLAEYTYHYKEIEDPALLAAAYIDVLRDAEQGFTVIDSGYHRVEEEPNVETLLGEIFLAKASTTEGKLFKVIVAWSEYSMAVQISQPDGKILAPPEPEVEEKEEDRPTALSEQMDFFNSLEPRDIGLEDSFSCRELDVYLEDVRDGSNVYMGTYYLSSNLQHLYRKSETGEIVSIDLK